MRPQATRRLATVAGIAALPALAAVIAGGWVPAAALVPLVGAVVLGAMEVVLPMPRAGGQEAGRGGRMMQGEETPVDVHVARTPLAGNLHIDPVLPDGMGVVPGSVAPLRPAGGVLVGGYDVRPARRVRHTPLTLRVARRDGLGLFARQKILPASDASVFPPNAPRQRGRVTPRSPGHVGQAARQRAQSGDEFYALREFQSGDEVRSVNWHATARMQRPIAAEHLPERPLRVVLYLDGRSFGVEEGGDDVFERTMRVAAELADALLRGGAHVGLVMLSTVTRRLVPAGGRRHARRIRDDILDARPITGATLLSLAFAGPPTTGAHAVLVTADAYDTTLPEAVRLLRRRHGDCILVAPAYPEPDGDGPRELAAAAAGALLNAELAAAMETHVHGSFLLWQPGAPVRELLRLLGRRR